MDRGCENVLFLALGDVGKLSVAILKFRGGKGGLSSSWNVDRSSGLSRFCRSQIEEESSNRGQH